MKSQMLSSVHVATVNVKFDGQRDNPVPIPTHGAVPPTTQSGNANVYGELPWAQRRSRLVDALLSTGELDFIGFQEVYYSQLQDLAQLLGSSYDHVGVGRDDGIQAGEYSPIFWNNNLFELVDWKTIWLSSTPERAGSIGWDASQTRIATLLSLKARASGEIVHVVNTHYDDRGKTARAESSLLIRQEIRNWVTTIEGKHHAGNGESLVVLMGDFNSPNIEDGYRNIISKAPLPNGEGSFSFLDSYTNLRERNTPGPSSSTTSKARLSTPYGPINTYTGFTAPGKTATERIDFIMIAASDSQGAEVSSIGRGGWWTRQYACVDNWIEEGDIDGWQGRWSDHRAVRVTISR